MSATDTPSSTIGARIAAQRHKQSMTQAGLARLAGLARSSLASIEHGERNMGIEVLIRIAEILGVPVGVLLGEEPDPDDVQARLRNHINALEHIRHAALLHYVGDAFDPEHMRGIGNLATTALDGGPVPPMPDPEHIRAGARAWALWLEEHSDTGQPEKPEPAAPPEARPPWRPVYRRGSKLAKTIYEQNPDNPGRGDRILAYADTAQTATEILRLLNTPPGERDYEGHTRHVLRVTADELDRQATASGECVTDYTDYLRACADDLDRWPDTAAWPEAEPDV